MGVESDLACCLYRGVNKHGLHNAGVVVQRHHTIQNSNNGKIVELPLDNIREKIKFSDESRQWGETGQ